MFYHFCSYDVLVGMDWLEDHRVNLDCYNNTFECMDEEGNPIVVKYSKGYFSKAGFSNAVEKFL